ncbi:gephyrin-like molybdotransferase Glp [Altericista sp. CCNU0014]|uniref:molybdopterin molybdotransferase MoeA n=1 Tax=Altericista sp. CCNU0014 TaxID=3082949 RepID=UPI00384DFFA4
MFSVQDAEAKILSLTYPLDPERDRQWMSLDEAEGRILAAEVQSALDFPYWDNSAMDGYAVRTTDLTTCSAESPVALEIAMEIPAGYHPPQGIAPGQAARIFTGAMMPPGADAVVIQERTQREGDRVFILERPEPQAWVRAKGDYYRAGAPLLYCGTRLNAPEIAILATAQCTPVAVYRRPAVSLLSTGNELVTPEQTLQSGQIVDSNQPAIAALVRQSGAIAQRLGIIPDERDALKAAILGAIATSDVVISTGGVSVGDYDYVEEILVELGGTLHIQSVAVKPGKPLTVATFPNPDPNNPRSILYFGLPGNPVSALVSFWRFVRPALKKLSGQSRSWGPTFIRAISRLDLKADGKRETYLWGQLVLRSDGTYEFDLAGGSHSSGNLINLANTNGLAVLSCDRPRVEAGEWVLVMQVS